MQTLAVGISITDTGTSGDAIIIDTVKPRWEKTENIEVTKQGSETFAAGIKIKEYLLKLENSAVQPI